MTIDEGDKEDLLARFHREQDETRAKLRASCIAPHLYVETALENSKRHERLLMAVAEYSPSPQIARRHLTFKSDGTGRKQELVQDAWLLEAHLPETRALLAAKRPLRTGGCDAMYATPATWVWTDDPDPADREANFELWNPKVLRCLASREDLFLYGGWWRPRHYVPVPEISAVAGRLSDDWVRRSVALIRRKGRPIDVAVARDFMPYLDPTYDALCLICDASWVRSLATALAAFLKVPIEIHEDI